MRTLRVPDVYRRPKEKRSDEKEINDLRRGRRRAREEGRNRRRPPRRLYRARRLHPRGADGHYSFRYYCCCCRRVLRIRGQEGGLSALCLPDRVRFRRKRIVPNDTN